MVKRIRKLLGLYPSVDYMQLVKQGAIIVDVRTRFEYKRGHIKGSINIPVDQLSANLHQFADKQTSIITCCVSGERSAEAKSILKSHGYSNVHDGGGWRSLMHKINSDKPAS